MAKWGGRKVTALRKQLEQTLPVPCARCGRPVLPGMAWDIGHTINVDIAPELMWVHELHRIEHSRCNRAAGARYGNRKRGRRSRRLPPPLTTTTNW